MFRKVRTGWIALLLMLVVATAATAALTTDAAQTVDEAGAQLQGEARQAAAEAEATARDALGQAARTGAEAADDAEEAAADTTAEAEQTGGTALQDAVTLLDETIVRPTEEQVQEVKRTVLGPGPAEEEAPDAAPAPASAAVQADAVATPALVAAGAAAAGVGALLFWMAGSSGGAAAGAGGAAGAGAKTLGHDLRRILPYASPLFTRFERDTVMGHPKREQLYARIVQEPGVSLQSLCDATGLSRTAVTHHLRLLEHHHVVVSRRVGRSRHYFENGGRYGRDQKEAYAILQNERSRQIAAYIRSNPGAIQKSVCSALGLQASIAHWHVRRLAEASLVESVRSGRTVSYYPTPGLQAIEA